MTDVERLAEKLYQEHLKECQAHKISSCSLTSYDFKECTAYILTLIQPLIEAIKHYLKKDVCRCESDFKLLHGQHLESCSYPRFQEALSAFQQEIKIGGEHQ